MLQRCSSWASPYSCFLLSLSAKLSIDLAVLQQDGDLHVACADMDVLQQVPPLSMEDLRDIDMLVMDANPPVSVLRDTALSASQAGSKVLWEPTSVPKAKAVAKDDLFMSCLSYATPNLDELWVMDQEEIPKQTDLEVIKDCAFRVLNRMNTRFAHLLVTLGSSGVVLASRNHPEQNPVFRHFPVHKEVIVHNATGAGDSLAGAFVHGLLEGMTESEAVLFGINAAVKSLECPDRAVSPDLGFLPTNAV